MEDGWWSKELRKTKNLEKCDYGWVQDPNETDAGDTRNWRVKHSHILI